MEGSGNSDVGCDQGSLLVTPYYTPYQKQILQKSGLQPVNMDLSPSTGGDSTVVSTKEGSGSPSSSSSDSADLEQQIQIVGEEKIDNILWARGNESYDELLREFIKNEEELKVSNFKLQLSETEIVNLKNQIEKREDQLDNVRKELKMKEDNLEYEKGNVLELQKQTADLETHVPDCCYKIAKLVEQLELANEQLKTSNDEIARLREELRSKSSDTHELQGQLDVAQENVATLECQLDSGRKQIGELEDRITLYKVNETNLELEVQKLKAEMLDAQVQFSLEKDQLHSDFVSLSEVKIQLGSRLEEWESRSNALENKLRQFEAEKLKLEELHASQQMVLQGEISCLKEELGLRRHDVEAVNNEFDRHKQKYDLLMTERDGANAKTHKLMAEVSFRDNQIANFERELFQLSAQQAELISGSETRLNLVNELNLKVEELEKEVTRQNAVISDRAEEKREAIRQLCFSLDHYRSGYQELLQAFTGYKRHAVIAS
ncbi:protein NETWORKED 4B [Gastrolobium bilobum]|uniref:protein NETWORKED 4B n=1 Tax=Gastrolobium bilobum TaxID=150636 RepID=UPI002AAF4850|nr:protein NETWORKED 4B [Gastrolobium bilobum]